MLSLERLEDRWLPANLLVPDVFPTIWDAFRDAQRNDTVVVGPGVYQGPFVVPDGVNLRGSGPDKTILQGSPTENEPVLLVEGSAGNLISDLTVTQGRAGGVLILNASPTLSKLA